jgi:hypothetical protein
MALDTPLRCAKDDLVVPGQNGFDRLELLGVIIIRQRRAWNLDIARILS